MYEEYQEKKNGVISFFVVVFILLFFFQAEDGIRDYKVTGVQTCALPIWATTAAWEASPPRAVRMPWATCMPCTSSGDVSLRTRIAGSPRSAAATTSSAVK